MQIKKNRTNLSFTIGGTNGQNFMIQWKIFKINKQRLTICFNTDGLIKFFGFNQKIIGC